MDKERRPGMGVPGRKAGSSLDHSRICTVRGYPGFLGFCLSAELPPGV